VPCGKYLRASASVLTIPSATSPLLTTALAAASTDAKGAPGLQAAIPASCAANTNS